MNKNYLVKMKMQRSKTNKEMGINKLEIRTTKNVNGDLWNNFFFFMVFL